MINWQNIIIKSDDTLEHAIKVLHGGGARITLVVGSKNQLLGTVTDGDIRRALIKKLPMNSKVNIIMNNKPIKSGMNFEKKDLIQLMIRKGLIHMPIVNEKDEICGLETIEHLIKNPLYKNPVLLMAGGLGTRLHPLTKHTPKPMLVIGKKPILETIIEQFIADGFYDFYISTCYKSDQIREYFQDGSQYGVSINYIHEDVPLGTAGSLGLLPNNLPDLPIIMMNGDILTKVDFKQLLDFHKSNAAEATMCVRGYDFQVPYGVVKIDGYNIKQIEEKPIYNFFVNAGIYVLNKKLIDKIHFNTHLDITDFLEKELNKEVVKAFPIHEYWLDIGRMEEYEKAHNDVITMFNK